MGVFKDKPTDVDRFIRLRGGEGGAEDGRWLVAAVMSLVLVGVI